MIILTLFLLVLMLTVGGMAVDFMRFESKRSMLQGVADRAVLAAADLDQELPPADVVRDYFKKAGMEDYLDGAPLVVTQGLSGYREVTVNGKADMNTYFLRLVGMDMLTARATSTAVEGIGSIEVSLVLDFSGSMHETIPGTTTRRIDRLKTAASNFIDQLLTPANANKISVSLVPYSEHVNVGRELFGLLNTISTHDYSYCVEFPDTAYDSTGIDDSVPLQQAQHLQTNSAYDINGDGLVDEFLSYEPAASLRIPAMNQPVCPQQDFEAIVPITQNAALLKANIAQLRPRSGTSIFMGMKWAVALLDPSSRALLSGLPSSMRDPNFSDRPAPWAASTTAASGATMKYVVLMSDGQNDTSWRFLPNHYDTPSEIALWASTNFPDYWTDVLGYDNWNNWLTLRYDPTNGDANLKKICDAAKKPERNIVVFTVAMGTDSDPVEDARGKAALSDCSSGPGYSFETSGAELDSIFQDIARQITDLRLTQ